MSLRSTFRRTVACAVAAAIASLATLVGPVALPAQAADAFHTYDGSTPLADIEPGTVLKTREITYSINGLPTPVAVVQLLFRTTDAVGRPSATVTSVIMPPAPLRMGDVVSYQSFYDSLNPEDGPSYALAGGTSAGGNAVHAEVATMLPFLTAGHPVIMADTQGATADFAAGPEYGTVTLDSLRAVLASPEAGIPDDPQIALVGYSGGAIGTNWAATLAAEYAPEIDALIVGAAEGGLLVAPARNLDYIAGSQVWAGVLMMAVVGVARAYEVNLRQYLNDHGRKVFADFQDASIAEVLFQYPGMTWQQVAREEFDDPEQIQIYVDTVNQLNLGQRPTPTMPMFIGQGAGGEAEGTAGDKPGIGPGDGVMIAGDVRTLARQYCDDGLPVTYREYPTSHFASVATWLPEAIAYTEARFAGVPVNENCSTIAAGNSLAPVPDPAQQGGSDDGEEPVAEPDESEDSDDGASGGDSDADNDESGVVVPTLVDAGQPTSSDAAAPAWLAAVLMLLGGLAAIFLVRRVRSG